MNLWTQKSLELASQRNYLDLLYRVYPMSVNLRREISDESASKIRRYLEMGNKKELLEILLSQEVFPIKDSYVSYLKRDRSAINRNPATVDRLYGILLEMGYDEIIEKTTVPKETNRQIGPLFKRWVNSGSLGVDITNDANHFLNFNGNIVFNGSDLEMKTIASTYLGYSHNKGLDFIAKFNNKYILAEAKFLTDFGGHQNAQFNDAIYTMKSNLVESGREVKIISILDGVLYINGNHHMMNTLNSFSDNDIVISAVLLRDYLFQL